MNEELLRIIELFDEDEVTTADKIDRPERALEREAFDDFMKRNPMAGGGMLVQPGFGGTRQGYADELTRRGTKRVNRILGDPITIDGKEYKKVIAGPDKGKYMIIGDKKDLAAGERAYREFVEKSKIRSTVKKRREAGKKSKEQLYVKRKGMAKNAILNRNNWIKNWINNNIDDYEVRDFNKFTKNLSDEFNKELLNNPDSYKYYMKTAQNIDPKTNLPILGTSSQGVTIDGIRFPRISGGRNEPNRNQIAAYKKWFYNKKLKDKDFKTKLNSYIDWNLTKKVEGGAGAMTKTAALDYGKFKKGFDDDVIFFMGEVLNDRALNPGGGQIGIHDIFKKNLGKRGKAYLTKYQGTWGRWRDNFDAVAKLAGLDQNQTKALLNKQINDSKNIMKLFNVKNLPPEFVVAQDHLFGLAEARELGDPKIARQTLKALVATTKEQNRILGLEGFSQKRVALIKKFKKAPLENKIGIVNQLNTLSEEFVPGRIKYNVRKDGSLKITNLQPEPTFKSKAAAYRELVKTFPANIKKRFSILGGGKCETRGLLNQGGRVGLRDGTPSIDVCFTNALERIKKGGVDFTNAEARNFNKLTKGLRAAGAANIIKYGVLPEILLEGALVADKMASEGDSFAQGLRNSYLAIPFQAMGVAKTYEEGEKDRILAATPESQKGKVLDVFNMQDKLNKKFELMGASEGFKRQIAATDAVSDGPFGYVDDSQDLQKRLSDTRADLQDLSRGDINRAERILTSSPLDLNIQDQLTMDAFKAATEKADADKASRILVAPGTGLEDVQIKKRMKDIPITTEYAKKELKKIGDYYGKGYTPFGLNKLITLMGGENPRFGYDEQGLYDEDRGLQDYTNYLRTAQFAENFRDEKAGGGIAKLAGDESGAMLESMNPDSQGLRSLKNRVRNS